MGTELSVLIPAFNEADNLAELLPELIGVLEGLGRSFEVIVVDDGSTDATAATMDPMRSDQVRYIRMRRNSGKSAALSLGFRHTRGEIVALMDADGQDDPAELPRLLERLERGDVHLVTGRRSVRHDRFVKRTTSKLYNGATARVTGVPGKDFNSGFKVMRRAVAQSLEMYGELHRYIPVLASWNGFRVDELEVNHRPRLHGRSKFGRARFWRGFLDLVTVKFLTTYTARPFHLFGGIGALLGLVGGGLLTWMGVSKALGNSIGDRPALIIGVLVSMVAVQMASLGLLAELVVNLRRRAILDADADGDLDP